MAPPCRRQSESRWIVVVCSLFPPLNGHSPHSLLGKLRAREAELCGQIEQVINEDCTAVKVTAAELDGVDDLDRFAKGPEPHTFMIEMKAPQVMPVLTLAHSEVCVCVWMSKKRDWWMVF